MKTSTLRHLVESLADVRHYHLASALLEADPIRQATERDEAFRVEAVLDAVRSELSIRETHGVRTPDDVRRADNRLERVLAEFLEFGDAAISQATRPAPNTPPGCVEAGVPATAAASSGQAAAANGHAGRGGAATVQADVDASPTREAHRAHQPLRRLRAL